MNKTIIININGIVFHIEEDAYEILKNYMTDVKRHFATSADSLEITTDIEYRIAEMFSEILLRENKQVIIEQDVKHVIEQMGSVADFENAENDATPAAASYTYKSESRRLFRDPDDHLVGGVCAGIANYFDINPVWIRLAFAVFAPIGGTGFLLYLILWIVVPKAVTRADKMAMKGEKQNLQGFKKNLEEEISSLKQNLTNFGYEAKPFVYKARDFIGDFFDHLAAFLGGAGKIFVKLLGIFILLCCFLLAVFLIVAFVALVGFGSFPPFEGLPVILLQHHHASFIYVSALLICFIPLLTIILITLKGIFNTATISRSTGTTFLVIWLCSVGFFIYFVVQVVSVYRDSAQFSETITIKPTKGNVYYLRLNDLKYFTASDSARLNIKGMAANVKITQDPYEYNDREHFDQRRIHLSIEKSDINQPVMIEEFRALGETYGNALFNARNASYHFIQQDTLLSFDYRLYSQREELYHQEELFITLRLPLNSKVVIDKKLSNVLDGASVYECNNINKREHADNATFTITANGLECKVDTLVTSMPDSIKSAIDSMRKPGAKDSTALIKK